MGAAAIQSVRQGCCSPPQEEVDGKAAGPFEACMQQCCDVDDKSSAKGPETEVLVQKLRNHTVEERPFDEEDPGYRDYRDPAPKSRTRPQDDEPKEEWSIARILFWFPIFPAVVGLLIWLIFFDGAEVAIEKCLPFLEEYPDVESLVADILPPVLLVVFLLFSLTLAPLVIRLPILKGMQKCRNSCCFWVNVLQ
eukprot:gb/GFBE01012727.1/.p1 GENE.gb/GFBE01012727.1/~~gb/GFBE01012727.1/.p1  ORF type:complete len:194 (+),score=47.09 gb/GFBE01012727.1/:1-582(+)